MSERNVKNSGNCVESILEVVREIFSPAVEVALHAPIFKGNEKKYLAECIDSSFVSYVGPFVRRFEELLCNFTGSKHAVATSSGTAALHVGLLAVGVRPGDEVITQALTFVATTNAISYAGARPIFLDSDQESFIGQDGACYNRMTKNRIYACVPVHVFGHPCAIHRIRELCATRNILVVEDAAESLGSYVGEQHTGTFGRIGILSFNGNKTITTGGGGAVLTDDTDVANRVRHLATTAKKPHAWEFWHDMVGFNYRLSNLGAAVGCAQMENIEPILRSKRELARRYKKSLEGLGPLFIDEPVGCKSNFWLNTLMMKDRQQREELLYRAQALGIMMRPVWGLVSWFPMYSDCQRGPLPIAERLVERLVNLPSSPIL
jgi:aminotransferase in exopolysaccharide biosynthesis